jgi:hypothetical protein
MEMVTQNRFTINNKFKMTYKPESITRYFKVYKQLEPNENGKLVFDCIGFRENGTFDGFYKIVDTGNDYDKETYEIQNLNKFPWEK